MVEKTKKPTIEEIIEEVIKDINTRCISDLERDVFDQIDMFMSILRGDSIGDDMGTKEFHMYSAAELSRIQGRLALLKDSLVGIVAKTARNQRIQEEVLKLRKANLRTIAKEKLKEEGDKITEEAIKGKVRSFVFRDKMKLAFKEEFATRAVYRWRSINSLLDTITNRINVLQSQYSDAGLDDSVDFETGELNLSNKKKE